MKRNLFRTVALITMLSLGASNAVANQETTEESIFTQKAVAQIVESLKDKALNVADAIQIYLNEHRMEVLNYGLPAVYTLVVAGILFKTWPSAEPAKVQSHRRAKKKAE